MPHAKRETVAILETLLPDSRVCPVEHGGGQPVPTMWMAFQPIVAMAGRRVFAYEALMRTRDATLPDPGAVLRDAERRDCLFDVGRQVRALSAESFAGAPPDTLLFVNLHPKDLLDPSLYDERAPLARIADRVVLEITERAALENIVDIAAHLAVLRHRGYRIAVDDLGSGYSGLSSLVALEPDFVKLDMSLVRDVHASPMRQRLVRSMAAVCKDMGMQIVAEGVQKAEECAALRELGCDLLQGYFFARPASPFPRVEGCQSASSCSHLKAAACGGRACGCASSTVPCRSGCP